MCDLDLNLDYLAIKYRFQKIIDRSNALVMADFHLERVFVWPSLGPNLWAINTRTPDTDVGLLRQNCKKTGIGTTFSVSLCLSRCCGIPKCQMASCITACGENSVRNWNILQNIIRLYTHANILYPPQKAVK